MIEETTEEYVDRRTKEILKYGNGRTKESYEYQYNVVYPILMEYTKNKPKPVKLG